MNQLFSDQKSCVTPPLLRVFLISMLMGGLLILFQGLHAQSLQWIGDETTRFLSPKPKDVFETQVKEKLRFLRNTFSLKRADNLIIPKAHASLDIPVPSFIAIDNKTGEVILEKNADQTRRVASLTKIMTAIVALDLADPSESFVVSEKAAKEIPTKIGVVENQTMTLEELLHALLMTSANDAASVIREGIDAKYGEDVFIQAMNEKADFIGLTNTSFDNPQGFDGKENFSTASDFAILSHYGLTHYPLISDIVKKEYTYIAENSAHKQFDILNWNGLIGVYPNVSGVKIGNTGAAGKTTVVVSNRDGYEVLVVLLGAQSVLDRDMYAATLLDRAFEDEFGLTPVSITREQLLAKYQTWNTYY